MPSFTVILVFNATRKKQFLCTSWHLSRPYHGDGWGEVSDDILRVPHHTVRNRWDFWEFGGFVVYWSELVLEIFFYKGAGGYKLRFMLKKKSKMIGNDHLGEAVTLVTSASWYSCAKFSNLYSELGWRVSQGYSQTTSRLITILKNTDSCFIFSTAKWLFATS